MSKGIIDKNIIDIKPVEEENLPMSFSSFQAGKGADIHDGNEHVKVPIFNGIKKDKTYMIRVSGDSMAPHIMEQDLVYIDTSFTNYKPGDVVAVSLNGDYMLKIYDPGAMCLYLSSYNQDYEPIRVYEQDECMILGKAIKIIRNI